MNQAAGRILVLLCCFFFCTAERKGCCFSDQIKAQGIATVGQFDTQANSASLINQNMTIQVDNTRNMMALKGVSTFSPGGYVNAFTMILDYNKNKSWYIVATKCDMIPIPPDQFHGACIPDKSRLEAIYNLSGQTVQVWVLPETPTFTLQRLTVTEEGCVPIEYTGVKFGKVSEMTTVQYFNVTKSVDDPSIFNVPSFCPE